MGARHCCCFGSHCSHCIELCWEGGGGWQSSTIVSSFKFTPLLLHWMTWLTLIIMFLTTLYFTFCLPGFLDVDIASSIQYIASDLNQSVLSWAQLLKSKTYMFYVHSIGLSYQTQVTSALLSATIKSEAATWKMYEETIYVRVHLVSSFPHRWRRKKENGSTKPPELMCIKMISFRYLCH